MAHEVNPPPQIRIPDKIFNDRELRSFFERLQTIIWQLWVKTGGAADTVTGKQFIVTVDSDVTLDNSYYGALVKVDASAGAVSVTLPPIEDADIGKSIDIAVIDATNNVTIISQDSTVLGDTSVVLTQKYMSIQFTLDSKTTWIGT